MELLENPALSDQIIKLLEAEYKIEKPMPHLTELIYCLTRSYFDRVDPVPPTKREVMLFAIGFGLERFLLQGQRRIEPGIFEGINFSPDFLAFSDVPGELKTTRASTKTFADKGLPVGWVRQILGYMKCLGVTEYELTILHLMGNYKPPFPEMLSYRCFSKPEELEANWNSISERKLIYLACMKEKVMPPIRAFCEDWECTLCRYAIRCESLEKGK